MRRLGLTVLVSVGVILAIGTPQSAIAAPEQRSSGAPAATDSTGIPPVRTVAWANMPFNGTDPPNVQGQVSWSLGLGQDNYDPCTNGGEPYKAACLFGGGSYYHITQGSMQSPNGIFIPNSEPSQSGSPHTVNHDWANKVYDGRIEIYPYGSGGQYDPWTQTVGGVHLSAKNHDAAGTDNGFTSLANGGVYSAPIGRISLPQAGQPGTGRIDGALLSNPGTPITDKRVQLDLFETDNNHHTSGGHDVGAFASLRSKNGNWTSGAVYNGDYIAFIEDTVTHVKIITFVTINGTTNIDLDLDAPCFGFNECQYDTGGPQSFAGSYHALTPSRILDTRSGLGHTADPVSQGDGWNGFEPNPFKRADSQANHEVQITGQGGVPLHGVSSVVLNVTAVGPTNTSYLTVYPKPARTAIFDDESSFLNTPTASNLNFTAGQTVANLVTVKVGAGGKVRLYNNTGSTHVLFDVVGWYDSGQVAGDGFTGLTPKRLLDTRNATGGPMQKFGAGETRQLAVTGGTTTVPVNASAVVLNLTATNTSTTSHVTAWPFGVIKPGVSNINVNCCETRPNLAIVKVGTNGQISLFNNAGTIDLLADVVGYFTPGSGAKFTATNPTRILDSRFGIGLSGAWTGPQSRNLQVGGAGGVPANAVGVVMNTTAVSPSVDSHLTVYPTGVTLPDSSNLNYTAGQTVPNLVIVKLGTGGASAGKDAIYNNAGNVNVIGDVNGWFG
jgi:hypothetical protein